MCLFFLNFVLGPGEIPVWQKQDLLQSWPGGFLGEAALGQIAYGLCLHPEDYSLLAGTQKVPEDEGVCHYYSETCTGSPGTLVSEDAKQEQKFDFRNFMDILDVFLKCFFCQLCQVSAANQSSYYHSAQCANVVEKETLPAAAFCSYHCSVLLEGSHG